jgi:hypothetical protein
MGRFVLSHMVHSPDFGAPRRAPLAAGFYPFSVAVDPSGRFVDVANVASDDVSTYAINTTTGKGTNPVT